MHTQPSESIRMTSLVPADLNYIKTAANNIINYIEAHRNAAKKESIKSLTSRKWYRPWKYSKEYAEEQINGDAFHDYNIYGWGVLAKAEAIKAAASHCKGSKFWLCTKDALFLYQYSR